jgi:hypothetical protein
MRRINVAVTLVLAFLAVISWAYVVYTATHPWGNLWHFSGFVYPALMAAVFTACSCLGWIILNVRHVRGDDELRCRKCKHILRGLSEPRCPECGEPI